MQLFHFLCRAAGDFSASCEWISQEIEHQYGQDRKTYYTLCFTSIVLTHGAMRPDSPHPSKGPIMIEMFTHIIMCKLLRSRSQGFITPPISCDRHTNEQRRRYECNRAAISFRFDSLLPPVSIYCKELNWPLKQHPGPSCCEDARVRHREMREKTKKIRF